MIALILALATTVHAAPAPVPTVICQVNESLGTSYGRRGYGETRKTFFHLSQGGEASHEGKLVGEMSVKMNVARGSINGVPALQVNGTIRDLRTGAESLSTSMLTNGGGRPESTLLALYSRANHDAVAVICTPEGLLRASALR